MALKEFRAQKEIYKKEHSSRLEFSQILVISLRHRLRDVRARDQEGEPGAAPGQLTYRRQGGRTEGCCTIVYNTQSQEGRHLFHYERYV